MASLGIHIAIAKTYMKKNPIKDAEAFLKGTVMPDAHFDNDKTHYTDKSRGSDNLSHVRGKVNLYAFLLEHPTLDDFELGWFLHLVTDFLFFSKCFSEDYLQKNSYEQFCKDLYYIYDCTNYYLEEKYDITIKNYTNWPDERFSCKKCLEDGLLTKAEIDLFIDYVSSIYLNDYIEKIKKYKKNIEP